MKVLVIGSTGFIGRNVASILSATHDVVRASRQANDTDICIDLDNSESIASVLSSIKPNAIINCAGVLGGDSNLLRNELLTGNLLKAVASSGLEFKRIVITSSAAVYGHIEASEIPVAETTPLRPYSDYGRNKQAEEDCALGYRNNSKLPIVIARIFNPLGPGMGEKFLTSNILNQLDEITQGNRQGLEVSRLDSKRDYLSVTDVAYGIGKLLDHDPAEAIYNLGSGTSTSNAELIDLILKNSTLLSRPTITEAAAEPEALVAIQADITRMQQEFNWLTEKTLEATIKEILDDHRQSSN